MKMEIPKNKRAVYWGLLIVVIIAFGIFAYDQNRRQSIPELTNEQKDKFAQYISKDDAAIQKDKFDRFAYLDKADYLRQLNREDEARAVLQEAYNVKGDWKETPDFLVVEARIASQVDEKDAIKRYESLLARESKNETFYSEYIGFLKRTKQDPEKIKEWYQKAMQNIPDTLLRNEYFQFIGEGK